MTTLIEYTEQQIKDVKYFYDDSLTICVITTTNDFKVIGSSYTAYMSKYDRIKGMEFAYKHAFDKLIEICAFYFKK